MNKIRGILFYNEMEGSRPRLALHWLINMLFLCLWCLGIGIVGLYFGKVNYGPELFASYFQYTWLFILNILPGLMLALLLFCIFNRVWPAVAGSGLIVIVLALINHFKLMFRDDPLIAGDIRYFSEAAQISSRYNISLTPAIALCAAALIAATVFSAFFLRARIRRGRNRMIALLCVLGASAGLYLGVYANSAVYNYTSNLKVSFADGYALNEYNETDKYCCRGFLYPLVHSFSQLQNAKPDGYTKAKAEQLNATFGESNIPEEKKVNFISVMMEAYYDFSTYSDIFTFETDPYSFYHQLQKESLTGTLTTNIFAGGTIDTERCYITGSTQMYNYRNAADSYARYFKSQGYFTEFCHPGYGWFYNRQNVMEYLGFDRANYFEDRYYTGEDVGILQDSRFFPDLKVLLDEAAADGKPYFNFSVTYQNHGPYADDYLYDGEREYVSGEGLSQEAYNILNNYFWGIKLSDDSLRSFIDSFRDSSEPVVIVLFGDHKPWLGDNASVYAELGIDLNTTTETGFYNYYDTQYLIWANPSAREVLGTDFSGNGGDFSPCFLMPEVLQACGLEGDGYTTALRELQQSVDIVNISGLYRENGVLTSQLTADAQSRLQKVLYLQYYRMHDYSGG